MVCKDCAKKIIETEKLSDSNYRYAKGQGLIYYVGSCDVCYNPIKITDVYYDFLDNSIVNRYNTMHAKKMISLYEKYSGGKLKAYDFNGTKFIHKKNIILFSGRFDNVHPGHLITIANLGKTYDKVIVCILDYPAQKHDIKYRRWTLKTMLDMTIGTYDVIVNNINFEQISKEEVNSLGVDFTIYGSGNVKCLDNMTKIGFDSIYVPRSFHYEASKIG